MLEVFLPNRAISKSTMTLLIAIQAAALYLLWVFSPFVFLPTQSETLTAFADLWRGGLGSDLLTSFTLNSSARWAKPYANMVTTEHWSSYHETGLATNRGLEEPLQF